MGVGAIIFQRDRVLLVERGHAPLEGWWSLPGGGVEVGERLDEAVRREIQEETGLEVKPGALFQVFERIMRDDAGRVEYHYVVLDYLCRVTGGKLCAGSDCAATEWVPRSRLGEYRITEGTRAVIERAFRSRAKHKR